MRFRGRTVRSVTLGTGIAVILAVPLAISVAAGATDDKLISRNRPAVASSASGSSTAPQATDGSSRTRWASAAGPGTQWVRIDLGAAQQINRVRLHWEKAYAKAYRVQASVDGANWSDLYTTDAGNGGVDDLKRLDGTGRYVRVLATQRGRPGGGYALSDIAAYGPARVTGRSVESAPVSGALAAGLENVAKRETAFELVSSAENSTLTWRASYGYLEDLKDGRGYTGGIVGFCSGTSDMLALVTEYTRRKPANVLAPYLPALRTVDGSDSHAGLDPGFPVAWKAAAKDPVFQKAQEDERNRVYLNPSLVIARGDGVRALGQFAYFDAAVMHGVSGMRAIRAKALRVAKSPAQGGDEITFLNAFLDARVAEMRTEAAHSDTTRVDTAQRLFLRRSNLDLAAPLTWAVYGDQFRIG